MQDQKSNGLTYADAGVDIDAGNQLVERIKPLAAMTARKGSDAGLGGFGAFFDPKAAGFKDPLLVSGTDGVGTKLKIAIEMNRHESVGIDLVAMCANDLIVQGAEPLFFLDYFACGKLSVETAEHVISGISEGCRQAGCTLIGGETAEMPGMYAAQDYDLAGFCVGAVERDQVLSGKDVTAGDILIGLPSSGVHSNGFSLVRHVLALSGMGLENPAPFAEGRTFGEVLLTPTRIYIRSGLAALRAGREQGDGVHGIVHITGGGFHENIPRILPDHLGCVIHEGCWEQPAVFDWIAKTGNIHRDEMFRTFNCGIGLILAVAPNSVEAVMAACREAGEMPVKIGSVGLREDIGQAVQITMAEK